MVWLSGFFWYLVLCAALSHLAGQKGHTKWLWFLFAVFWTPFVGALFLAAAAQRTSDWNAVRELNQPMPERRTAFTDV